MRSLARFAWVAVALGAAFGFGARDALAQDPYKLAPKNYTKIQENEKIRAFEVRLSPGDKIATHSHPGHFVYAFTEVKMRFTDARTGKSEEVTLRPGESSWMGPTTHSTEFLGDKEARLLVIEVRDATREATRRPGAPEPGLLGAGLEKERYFLIVPHTSENCLKAMDDVAKNPDLLNDTWFGCKAGDHRAYMLVRAESEDEARRRVPTDLRKEVQIRRVEQLTAEDIRSFHEKEVKKEKERK